MKNVQCYLLLYVLTYRMKKLIVILSLFFICYLFWFKKTFRDGIWKLSNYYKKRTGAIFLNENLPYDIRSAIYYDNYETTRTLKAICDELYSKTPQLNAIFLFIVDSLNPNYGLFYYRKIFALKFVT